MGGEDAEDAALGEDAQTDRRSSETDRQSGRRRSSLGEETALEGKKKKKPKVPCLQNLALP